MDAASAGYHCSVGSGRVTSQPAQLVGVNVSVATSGDYIDLYDGRDATSGTRVMRVGCLANRSQPVSIPGGIKCTRGIYVSCSVSTVIWSVFFNNLIEGPYPVLEV